MQRSGKASLRKPCISAISRCRTRSDRFEEEFQRLYGLRIRFADDALHELAKLVLNGSEEALIVCRKIFQNYHHGLKLVMERSESHEFTISKEAIQNPERYLNDMIQKTYSQ